MKEGEDLSRPPEREAAGPTVAGEAVAGAEGVAAGAVDAADADAIRAALKILAARVHDHQVRIGFWPDGKLAEGSEVDYRAFFAGLHSTVSAAYDAYDEQPDPTRLSWIGASEENFGIPQGLGVDLAQVVLSVFGFAAEIGIDLPEIVSLMAVGQEVEEILPDDADDEGSDDLLEELLKKGDEP
jgi:hypothetical protein